jgi:integrase
LIADVLQVYASEHLPHTIAAKKTSYSVTDLGEWWGDKKLSDVTTKACRAYAQSKKSSWARRNLEVLRAAIRHFHREHGPLPLVPAVWMPPKPEPRERWLTKSEAARLLWVARHMPHLARVILLGLYTGSRLDVMLSLQWDWIDLERGLMRRRAPGARESKKRTPPVRLGHRILAHLLRWYRLDGQHCAYVCHYNGRRMSSVRSSWKTAVKRAGLGGDVTPHTLRHTRATWGMQKGIDTWQLAGHLGMTLRTLERVYGKHSPDYQREAAEF